MFVFVGGIQPSVESKAVDQECPVCHRSSTQEKTVNQVLSMFFVPLFTVHRGEPYRVCPQCGWDSKQADGWQLLGRDFSQQQQQPGTPDSSSSSRGDASAAASAPNMPMSCSQCGHSVQPNYLFCPFCGTFLKD